MEHAAMSSLSAWESFYVIVGSSAGALTGLQFVVMALIAESWPRNSEKEVAAFGTPTIVHFGAVLLTSAVLSAPWPALGGPALILGISGIVGIVYMVWVLRTARQQSDYKPVLEDWIWHFTLPLIAYVALSGAVLGLRSHPGGALFVIGGITVLLLFVGIHNAWDSVTYIAIDRRSEHRRDQG